MEPAKSSVDFQNPEPKILNLKTFEPALNLPPSVRPELASTALIVPEENGSSSSRCQAMPKMAAVYCAEARLRLDVPVYAMYQL